MLRRTVPFTAAPLACISATTLISRRFTHHQPMATDAEKITPPKWDKAKGDEAALNAQTHHEAKRFTGEAGRYGASAAATATSDTDTGGAAAAAGGGSTRLTTEDRDANRSDGSTRSDKEGKQMYEQMAEYDASHPKNQAAS